MLKKRLSSVRQVTLPTKGRIGGFTLLEVLVAIMILAIGLLGVAALQAVSIRNNQSAYFRSQATLLAYDVIDRMRSNTSLAHAGSYNVTFGSSGSGSGMAGIDITEWKDALAQTLPSGDGAVTIDLAGNTTVELRWLDERKAPTDTNTDPNCPSGSAGNIVCFITQTKL
jgi:type IV pilus assembly protein PilV